MDEIAIQYVLVTSYAAKKRPGEAFKGKHNLYRELSYYQKFIWR